MISASEIKVIIREQEERMQEMFKEGKIIERELVIEPRAITSGVANIITGPRRCGKSVFAYQLAGRESFGYINFDDERLKLDPSDLNTVLEAIYSVKGDVRLIVFDEIQEVQGWEKFVSRLVESKRLIITGSNARMMSTELATYMTGRHIDRELLPFSFAEFLDYKGLKTNKQGVYSTIEKSKIIPHLEEYLNNGGFPLGIKLGRSYLSELYKDLIQRDIIQRHRVKMTTKISDLAKYLISNSASEISYSKLRKVFGVASKHTIQDWIAFMEQAYIIFKLERFSFKLKESIIAPKKVYAIDTGFMNTVSSETSISMSMETVVAIELLRRNYYLGHSDTQLNYWKSHSQKEADFVIRRKNKVLELIQVTYASKEADIKDREIENLISASTDLKCGNLTVVTWDYEREIKNSGKIIRLVPLWKWLLEPKNSRRN